MKEVHGFPRVAALLCWFMAPALMMPGPSGAQSKDPDGELVYHARPRDTLIGLGRRLLREPHRWPEVQARNNIANPLRIPLGHEIRIPYAWLRLSPDVATVMAVSGDVREGGNVVSASQALSEGSRLRTGANGSVTLLLADGSLVTLQKLGALGLEEMRRVTGLEGAHATRFKLESGRLQTRVKPHGDMGRFEIVTPVAVSAVRGTEFRGAFDPDTADATTETLEGAVEVSGKTAAVTVPADFGTRVRQNAAPLPPVPLLPPPDLQALSGTNGAKRLQLSWPAVPGAARYRVQIAPEPEFHSFVVDSEMDAPELDLAAPADGSYWLRVRGIDELGLEGHDAVRSLTQHELPAPPSPGAPLTGSEIVGDGATFTWTASGEGAHYHVQIARDADFSAIFLELDAGTATHLDVQRVPPGRYFWRVASSNDRGEHGEWSPAHQYNQWKSSPTPYPPVFSGKQMQLHWDSQEGMRYHVQVARDPEFNQLLVDETVDAPGLSTARPRPGVYYVRVRTIAPDDSKAPFGKTVKLDIPVPLWIKLLGPLLVLTVALVQ